MVIFFSNSGTVSTRLLYDTRQEIVKRNKIEIKRSRQYNFFKRINYNKLHVETNLLIGPVCFKLKMRGNVCLQQCVENRWKMGVDLDLLRETGFSWAKGVCLFILKVIWLAVHFERGGLYVVWYLIAVRTFCIVSLFCDSRFTDNYYY